MGDRGTPNMSLRILLLCFIAIHSVRADSNGCVCQGDNCDLESTLTDGKSTGTQNNSKVAQRVQINFPSASSVGVACYLFNGTSNTYDLECYELDISYDSSNTMTTTVDGVNSTFPGNLSATLGKDPSQITGMSPSPTTFTMTTVKGRTMICTQSKCGALTKSNSGVFSVSSWSSSFSSRRSISQRRSTQVCTWIGASSGTDAWCNSNCNNVPSFCPSTSCSCTTEASATSVTSVGSSNNGVVVKMTCDSNNQCCPQAAAMVTASANSGYCVTGSPSNACKSCSTEGNCGGTGDGVTGTVYCQVSQGCSSSRRRASTTTSVAGTWKDLGNASECKVPGESNVVAAGLDSECSLMCYPEYKTIETSTSTGTTSGGLAGYCVCNSPSNAGATCDRESNCGGTGNGVSGTVYCQLQTKPVCSRRSDWPALIDSRRSDSDSYSGTCQMGYTASNGVLTLSNLTYPWRTDTDKMPSNLILTVLNPDLAVLCWEEEKHGYCRLWNRDNGFENQGKQTFSHSIAPGSLSVTPIGDTTSSSDSLTALSCTWVGTSSGTDAWCDTNCNSVPANCPAASCDCNVTTSNVGTLGVTACYQDANDYTGNCKMYYAKSAAAADAGTINATYTYKIKQYKDSLEGGFVRPGVSSKMAAVGGVSSGYPDVVAACYGSSSTSDTNFQGCVAINSVASCMADSDDGSSGLAWWIILLIILAILLLCCCIGFIIIWFCCGGAGDKEEEDIEDGVAITNPSSKGAPTMGSTPNPISHTTTTTTTTTTSKSGHGVIGSHGIPKGCVDYGVVDGKLAKLDHEGDWRMAGDAKPGQGFELTQDADNQEGHLLCRVKFETRTNELHASLEYSMTPKSAAQGGGQGLCVYLVDPDVAGWDRHFDGSGPLGFVGKKGAIVGVGIDCTGTFCDGEPASIAVKRASDGKLLCDPVALKGGVVTPGHEFREVKIKFDIEENKVDVTIGGKKVLDDIKFEGIKIPRTVCIGVCAGTADGHNNKIAVNKLKIKGEM